MIDFSNKVALVTGGSRGIGAATVKAIVSAGGSVVIHYGSNTKAAEMLAAEVGNAQCHIVRCDLSKPGAASNLWRDAIVWKDQIDIVILDMIMPEMDGGDTYDRLRKINPEIKVLLSSGYSVDGQATEILERGCDGFIQKPFSMKDLSRKIREILDS